MERAELLKRISIDPRVCFGKPCIRGTRIWVFLILDQLATGVSIEEILACMAYGAEMSRERFVDIPHARPA